MATGPAGGVTYRPAREDDLEASWDIFVAAASDLRVRSRRPPLVITPQRRARGLAVRAYTLTRDPGGFWVAEAEGRVVAFGIGTLRENLWYLAALHVLPDYQARGVGGELIRRCVAIAPRGAVLTTMSETAQPVANALYARHGMFQWVPKLYLTGPTEPTGRGAGAGAAAARLEARPFEPGEAIDGVDRSALGVARPDDHRHWLRQPDLIGLAFRSGDEVVGYAYVSRAGAIGPVAVRRATAMPEVLERAIDAARGLGVEQASLPMPGHCRPGLRYLLGRGFRIGEGINTLHASRPFGRPDRYVHSAGDALY